MCENSENPCWLPHKTCLLLLTCHLTARHRTEDGKNPSTVIFLLRPVGFPEPWVARCLSYPVRSYLRDFHFGAVLQAYVLLAFVDVWRWVVRLTKENFNLYLIGKSWKV